MNSKLVHTSFNLSAIFAQYESFIFCAGLFLLTSFYVASQAIDIFVFHFIVDIYLARIAMAIMAVGLALMLGREFLNHVGEFRNLIILIAGWCIYLVINAFWGINPVASLKLLVRFVGAWVIALEIGILIYSRGAKSKYVIGFALLFTLLIILFAMHLQAVNSPYLRWLKSGLRNYHAHEAARAQAFYATPNTLGIVLVLHAAAAIWYTFHKYFSLAILPGVWAIAFFNILQTQSRSSLIGISSVGVFAVCAYYKLFLTKSPKKVKAIFAVMILCAVSFGLVPLSHQNLKRFDSVTSKISSVKWDDLKSGQAIEKLAAIDPGRVQIWKRASAYWKLKPLTGVGLGAFRHMPNETMPHAHNFLLNILVEQGVIGVTFLIAFVCFLLNETRNWACLLLLGCLLFSQLFDDLTPCVAFPIYTSLILGYCFTEVLQTKRRKETLAASAHIAAARECEEHTGSLVT